MRKLVPVLVLLFAMPAQSSEVTRVESEVGQFLSRGNTDAALRALERARTDLDALPQTRESVASLRTMASQFRAVGARQSAIEVLKRGVILAERVDQAAVKELLSELGNAQGEMEAHDDAYTTFTRLASESSEPFVRANAVIGALKAEVRSRDRKAEVKRMFDLFAGAVAGLSDSALCDVSLQLVGTLLRSRWAVEYQFDINRWLDRAEATARRDKNLTDLSYAIGFRASLAEQEKRIPAALAASREALLVATRAAKPELIYRWQWQIARQLNLAGQRTQAIAVYGEAIVSLGAIQSELLRDSYLVFKERVLPVYNERIDLLLLEAQTDMPEQQRQALLLQVQSTVEQLNKSEVLDYFDDDCLLPQVTTRLDQISADTAVIYPIVMSDRLVVVVKMSDGIHQYVQEISSSDLENLVNDFRENIEGIDDYKDEALELYELLIAPMERGLNKFAVKRLLFIPSTVFRTIPMSALFDGSQHLIERFDIVTTLGLELTDPRPMVAQAGAPMLAGISDSVGRNIPGLGIDQVALPAVVPELNSIRDTLGGNIILNSDFTVERAAAELERGGYSRVHIATHGFFDSEASSSFLLTYDEKLTLDRLQDTVGNRRFLGEPLDLLVLSACQTAAGNERAALGLAGVSLKAGARSTIATLWPIADDSTSSLMIDFYGELNGGNSKAGALRAAQLNLLNSPEFDHPYFWSAFLLIGNWL